MVISGRRRGGDVCTHNLPLTGIYKGIFAQVVVYALGVDRYVFFRADTDTDYYRSSRPITDILNRYTCLV